VTTEDLARSYLEKARVRLAVLDLLMAERAYSDVVREGQETVERALKAMLRYVGVDPPKVHDVGPALEQYRDRFPDDVPLDRLVAISRELREDREKAFYGDIDFIPTEEYSAEDGERARDGARLAAAAAQQVIGPATSRNGAVGEGAGGVS
jgi:HEPN domain-containing protein